MTRKPSIPMTPSALPKQRSPQETVLPDRPEGFQGYCDWCWNWGHKKPQCWAFQKTQQYRDLKAKWDAAGRRGGGRD